MQKPSSEALLKAVVVASACVISFLMYGTARLSAQLFQASRERFNVGRKEAALPFVLAFTVRNISGPFAGFLGDKFGLRCVTVLGCAVTAASIGACYLVEDIIAFTVLWGGCFGIGFGMGSTLIANILHNCFTTNFNKMYGVFMASACMGSFVLPGITEYLLKTYGTSGTFLILSGFVLHCIPAAMLLKPPGKSPKNQIKELGDTNRIHKEIKTTFIEHTNSFKNRNTQQTSQSDSKSFGVKNAETVQFPCSLNDCTAQKANTVGICCKSSCITEDTNLSEKNILREVESLTDITHEVKRNREKNHSFVSDTELQKEIPDSDKHLDASDSKRNTHSISKLHRQSNSKSRNFQVFLDPAYIIILISISLATVVVITMYTVIADVCRDKGITEDVTVLMTFAIMDMVGRIFTGYMADGGYISPLNIYALCCACCGLLMIGFIYVDNFYVVLVFIAAIGALMGSIIVGPPGIIRNYIKKEDITMAFSSSLFLFALLNISQPPVIGYFRETLHSYAGLFYLLGSMCLSSAIIALLIPSAARLRDRKKSHNKVYFASK